MMQVAAEKRCDVRPGLRDDEMIYVEEFCDPS